MVACRSGNVTIIDAFFNNSSKINFDKTDNRGYSGILLGIKHGCRSSLMKIFSFCKSNKKYLFDTRNRSNENGLVLALRGGRKKIVHFLLCEFPEMLELELARSILRLKIGWEWVVFQKYLNMEYT